MRRRQAAPFHSQGLGWVVRGLGGAQDGFRHVLGLWEGHQETGSVWRPATFQGET